MMFLAKIIKEGGRYGTAANWTGFAAAEPPPAEKGIGGGTAAAYWTAFATAEPWPAEKG